MLDIDVNEHRPSADSAFARIAAVCTSAGRVRPVASSGVTLVPGLLHGWQERNRGRTIPHTIRELRAAGNIDNLRTIADGGTAPFRGRYPFLDTDLFKTLEGLAYELARDDAARETRQFYDEIVDLIIRAQREDGYLNSFFQHPATAKQPWQDLAWGHELYNLGHLIQAAIAAMRQLGDDRLLGVATRFADLAVSKFGPTGDNQVCGHPEIEMALVELFRATGTRDYLTLAKLFVDRRGHGTLALSVFPAEYFQDKVPLRELPSVTGHAVRMVYLAAGATDVAIETGDTELLAAMTRLWDDMVASKLYITGGLGSRHSDEAIGDRYELPSERSYSETCAAIGTMQWAWRLFIATGGSCYLDVFETVLYNAYAAGLSDDGSAFFYDNPLQRREDHQQRSGAEPHGELLRRAWFVCPCCPPNIVRWNAQLQDYVAATDEDTLYLAQYTNADLSVGDVDARMRTNYPWSGDITVSIDRIGRDTTTVALRIPAWCRDATVTVNGEPVPGVAGDGWLRVTGGLSAGDQLQLSLAMPVRAHGSHPYLDATRGSLSIARGPLVYCAEQQDNHDSLDDLLVIPDAAREATTLSRPVTAHGPADTVLIALPVVLAPEASPELYPELTPPELPAEPAATSTASLIPYYQWGNREARAMRVWLRQR
jgi:uncharacterized protein